MVYLDNAATSYPKPPDVHRAVAEALVHFGGNPGRGGHRLSMRTAQRVYECREALASYFHAEDPSGVVFTVNCTTALNYVIKGILSNGGHAIVTDMEHNAVIRPLHALKERNVTYTEVAVDPLHPSETAVRVERAIQPNTRLILCTHASNVTGACTPIAAIGKVAKHYGIPFAVDAAQTAGILPICMTTMNIQFLCIPGHKGLYGPMGCGALICQGAPQLHTLIEGGTGSASANPLQPPELPDHLESGTVPTPAICGLYGGLSFLNRNRWVASHESDLLCELYARLKNTRGVTVYSPPPDLASAVPLIACNVNGHSSEEVAQRLDEEGIAVRAGLQCAPTAHRKIGTVDTGVVRISPSAFTTGADLEKVRKILTEITRNP